MAETIIGSANSVASTVEVLIKTVSAMHDLHSRWKQADLTFFNLIAQLTALKVALDKLQEWIDADMKEQYHHQLVMDLGVSMTCCAMLVGKVDLEISELQRAENHGLDSKSKMELMAKNCTFEDLQKMVERQTSALTLLLTVCDCKAISEQKKLLQLPSTKNIFRRVMDNTSSLCVQRDSISISSRWTGRRSNWSEVFDLDVELFGTKVYCAVYSTLLRWSMTASEALIEKIYERSVQRSLKRMVSFKSEPMDGTLLENFVPRLIENFQEQRILEIIQGIDRTLENESRRRDECKVLVMGDSYYGLLFMNSLGILHKSRDTSKDERFLYRGRVREAAVDLMKAILEFIQGVDIKFDEAATNQIGILSQELEKVQNGDKSVSSVAANAVQVLWTREELRKMFLENADQYVVNSALYFTQEIRSIAQEDYIPSARDIVRTQVRETGIQEHRITNRHLSIHLLQVSDQLSARTKRVQQFENITSIVFAVDLSCYDEASLEHPSLTRMTETMLLFESLTEARWFVRKSVILLLCNDQRLKQKLACSPLRNYFPDFHGPNEFSNATEYIIRRFRRAIPFMKFSWLVCKDKAALDASVVRDFIKIIKEARVDNILREAGFL